MGMMTRTLFPKYRPPLPGSSAVAVELGRVRIVADAISRFLTIDRSQAIGMQYKRVIDVQFEMLSPDYNPTRFEMLAHQVYGAFVVLCIGDENEVSGLAGAYRTDCVRLNDNRSDDEDADVVSEENTFLPLDEAHRARLGEIQFIVRSKESAFRSYCSGGPVNKGRGAAVGVRGVDDRDLSALDQGRSTSNVAFFSEIKKLRKKPGAADCVATYESPLCAFGVVVISLSFGIINCDNTLSRNRD